MHCFAKFAGIEIVPLGACPPAPTQTCLPGARPDDSAELRRSPRCFPSERLAKTCENCEPGTTRVFLVETEDPSQYYTYQLLGSVLDFTAVGGK